MTVFDRSAAEDLAVRQRQAAARRSMLLPAAMAAVLGASAGLSHAFTTLGFLPLTVALTALAFGLGWVGRRLAVPGVLAPFVSFVGLAVVLGWVYAGETTAFGVPTGDTARALGEILARALDDVRVLVAPVEINPDLRLLTAAGVFAVAVGVDLIVFRLRRPAVAGLPLLALYVIPTSVRDEAPGVLPFALAAAGYVALLIAEGRDRAKGWGRRLAGRDVVEELVDVSPVARVGRRLGAAAVCLAVAVPLFVPDLGEGFLGPAVGGGSGLGDGPSSREVINPIVELAPQLRNPKPTPLLSVRTDRPDYLRLTSLDLYEVDRRGERWKQSALSAPAERRVDDKRLPRPPGAAGIDLVDATLDVEVRNLDVPWLPAPYSPSYIDVEGDWRYDESSMTVFSARQTTRRLRYSVESKIPNPSMLELSGAPDASESLERYRELPSDDLSPVVEGVLARELRGATTPFEQALALQTFFRQSGGFVYDLSVEPGQTRNQLDRFLTDRRGYCEQFAATFAYLMRALDVPARVAIGFTPGTLQDDGSYLITNREAHAWPEVYFANVGWIRFEPTPRNDDVRTIPPEYADEEEPGEGGTEPSAAPSASAAPAPSASATNNPIRENPEDNEDAADPSATGAGDDAGGIPWTLLLAASLGAVAVSAPAATRQVVRRRRRRAATEPVAVANAAWADLADDAEDLGFPLRRSDSPRQAAARLSAEAELTGGAADALTAVSRAEERARYAPTPPTADGLADQVRAVRKALAERQTWPLRLRAALLPASTLRRARATSRDLARRAGEAVGSLGDGVAERLPSRLRGGRHSV